jgi:hypothetical protein
MQETIKLTTSIFVNGVERKEFIYDVDEITVELFAMAELAKIKAVSNKDPFALIEGDQLLHLYLGFAAIIAKNPELDFAQINEIKGKDIIRVVKIGRNFIVYAAEQVFTEENLEEQSEVTPAPLIPLSQNLENGD